MKNNDFNINFTVVCVLLIASLLLIIVSLNLNDALFRTVLCSFGMGVFSVSWHVVFVDILKQKVYNRQFWIISMFALTTVAPIVYLIRRNKIILE